MLDQINSGFIVMEDNSTPKSFELLSPKGWYNPGKDYWTKVLTVSYIHRQICTNVFKHEVYMDVHTLHFMILHTPYIPFFHRVHINHLCTLSTKLVKCTGSDFTV